MSLLRPKRFGNVPDGLTPYHREFMQKLSDAVNILIGAIRSQGDTTTPPRSQAVTFGDLDALDLAGGSGSGGLPGRDGTSGLPNLYDPNDDGVLRMVAISGFSTNLELEGATPKAYVAAMDCLIAVQGGTQPFTYYLKKAGGAYGAGNTDPSQEVLSYGAADIGVASFYIKIADSLGVWSETSVYVIVQDNKGLS